MNECKGKKVDHCVTFRANGDMAGCLLAQFEKKALMPQRRLDDCLDGNRRRAPADTRAWVRSRMPSRSQKTVAKSFPGVELRAMPQGPCGNNCLAGAAQARTTFQQKRRACSAPTNSSVPDGLLSVVGAAQPRQTCPVGTTLVALAALPQYARNHVWAPDCLLLRRNETWW